MNTDLINNSNYYIPEDLPRKKKKKETRKNAVAKQNAGLVVLSVLLSIILTVNLICAIVLTSLSGVFEKKNIELLLNSVTEDIDIGAIEIPTEDGTQPLSDLLLDMAYEYKGFRGITKEDIDFEKLEAFAKLFIMQMIENNDSSDGIASLGWTAEQIYDFLESNQETIRDLLISSGYEGKIPIEENKDELIKTLKKSLGEDGITIGSIIENVDESGNILSYLNTVQALFSASTILIIWCLAVLLVLILLPVNLKFYGAYMRSFSIPMVVSGGLISLIVLIAGSLLKSLPLIDNETLKNIILSAFGVISKQISNLSVTVLIAGIIITVISIVVDIVRNRKYA